MQFNSYIFILAFLPITILGYNSCTKRNVLLSKAFLLTASCVFYAYAGWQCALWLIGSVLLNYLFIILIRRSNKTSKMFLILSVIANICALLYCKYYNFFVENINSLFLADLPLRTIFLPLGISFFTFQQIMYLVNVYKGNNNIGGFLDYLLYILYFPKILMGPITEPEDLIRQFDQPNSLCLERIQKGIMQFSFGLFKKVIIADTFAAAVNWGFAQIVDASSIELLLVMLFYTFQIYFDFSGYSDMAIGVSNMLGIELPINFDSPYKAISIRDFWKRWHISLTQYFTKYLYFPLGGNRKGRIRTYINIMIIFIVSGLWHGASNTFVLWGFLNGAVCVFDRVFDKIESKIPKAIRWFLTFGILNVFWLLFRSEAVSQWKEILLRIIKFDSFIIREDFFEAFSLPEFLWNGLSWGPVLTMIIMVVAAFLICLLPKNNYKRSFSTSKRNMILGAIALVWSVISLSGEAVFIYLNF